VESDEVVSPKIDVDDIDDNEDNVSPTNSAPKLSGFGGIGLGWGRLGLGLTKWGAASQGSDSTSPNGSAIGSKKTTPVDETPKDLFPPTKKELSESIANQKKVEPEPLPEPEPVVEVVEPEPEPVKDEIPEQATEPVIMPQEAPVEDDFGYVKKGKKGKKVEKKPTKAAATVPEETEKKKTGKVASTVTEETEKKKTGKVASLAGVYEKRASTIKKDVVEKPTKSKSRSTAIPVEIPTEPEVPEPEPVVEPPAKEPKDEQESYYGPGYEKVKQRKYADTPEVRYAGKSNIGYVPTPEETPYVPIPKEPAYAPVPEGPKYAEPKQFEYATPNIWSLGKKGRRNGKAEVATAPAPPPPIVERVPTPEPEPIPDPVVEQPEPEPEPEPIVEPEPVPVPEPVKPTKHEKKQKKKKGWFFAEPEESEPEPVPEPPVEVVPIAEEVQVTEAEPEPEEEEPGAEFVEAVAEVVDAEPELEIPAIVEPETAPAPGPEARRTRKDVKDVSVWSLLAPPKPKKKSPGPEVSIAPTCSLSPSPPTSPQDSESAEKHQAGKDGDVDTSVSVKKPKERRLSAEVVDANGGPVKTVGLRELWKMNKEVERKKKNARGLSPVERWQADVVPEVPPDEDEYNSTEEIEKDGHVDAAGSSHPPAALCCDVFHASWLSLPLANMCVPCRCRYSAVISPSNNASNRVLSCPRYPYRCASTVTSLERGTTPFRTSLSQVFFKERQEKE
jgi:hypothetical protein